MKRLLTALTLIIGTAGIFAPRGVEKDLSSLVPKNSQTRKTLKDCWANQKGYALPTTKPEQLHEDFPIPIAQMQNPYEREDLHNAYAHGYMQGRLDSTIITLDRIGDKEYVVTDVSGRKTRIDFFNSHGFGVRSTSQPDKPEVFEFKEPSKEKTPKRPLPDSKGNVRYLVSQ